MFRWVRYLSCLALALHLLGIHGYGSDDARPGVLANFSSAGKTDSLVLPNFWFFQPEGEPPTSLLPDQPYTAELTGLVSVDLRNRYSLEAELNGSLKVTVNGEPVMDVTAAGGVTESSKPFRLNKGTNLVVATFTPPPNGPAQLRLFWIPRKSFPQPIPTSAITHLPETSLGTATVRRGRTLFANLRCSKCHEPGTARSLDPALDAPDLTAIGDRLQVDWMARWIESPSTERPGARMPKMLHGGESRADARAIAAYLGSLQETRLRPADEPIGDKAAGERLFANLLCTACHSEPSDTSPDPKLVALHRRGEKYLPGRLEDYLLNPQAHYRWNRMPNFKLSREESADLTAYLTAGAAPAVPVTEAEPSELERGKALVQTIGCLNCHSLELENRYMPGPELVRLHQHPEGGCLAEKPSPAAPDFRLNARDREALQAFLAQDFPAPGHDTLRERALWLTAEFNCRACHTTAAGFTRFDLLGEKFDPAWSAAFISGRLKEKPRPWLPARMPAFAGHGDELAKGLAVLHGFPPDNVSRKPRDVPDLAEIGRKLVSAEGGFSCTSCHAVGASPPAQVFEAPGINLAQSGRRLRETFFHRWMLDPLAVDPSTKMPVYFDSEGRSPLADVFAGDARRQIEAIGEYLRLEAEALQNP